MKLKGYIQRYINLTEQEYIVFLSYLDTKSFKPGEKLLDFKERCQKRFFIKKGCVRMYGYTEKGKEQIYHFAIENWWISNYESLLNNTPSYLIIEAIEPTEVYYLTSEKFELLCQQLPKIERMFRMIMERAYIAFQKRLEFLFNLSSEEQYRHFIKVNAKFTQRIPQYMLASYLGVTPEFISKIRSKI
ncbi:MAG: Crp/Fnr family transcriptional regulator [Mesonia hippocampi]|uniref:Crp/Fnr family transcriptional regulator n=1 Tax=Mesonia hippocampi TaxID=1628250 RepID=UPI003F9CF367